jgi:hypothetical protein
MKCQNLAGFNDKVSSFEVGLVKPIVPEITQDDVTKLKQKHLQEVN